MIVSTKIMMTISGILCIIKGLKKERDEIVEERETETNS